MDSNTMVSSRIHTSPEISPWQRITVGSRQNFNGSDSFVTIETETGFRIIDFNL